MKSKKILSLFCMVFCFAMLNVSCSDDDLPGAKYSEDTKPDLSTKIKNSVYGFVTNEKDEPFAGVAIVAGDKTATTDENGYFEITDASVVKDYGVVSAEASGYFKGIRTWVSENDKKQFVRIKLLPKTVAGTFKSADGGEVKLSNGLKLTFPADAIVDKASKAAYSGNVSVALQWLNPVGETFTSEMPGDLRAINSEGYVRSLISFGMVAAELRGDGGQELQIAEGKAVAVRAPIESEQRSEAPEIMPLWFFNEDKGLWEEEGEAKKEGNEYVGKFSHFSTWNLDVPYRSIRVTARFVDENNNPIVGHRVYFTSSTLIYGSSYTDANGYLSTYVTSRGSSATMVLSAECTVYSSSVSMTQGNQDLGTIKIAGINLTSSVTNLSGTVVNCNGDPVTNGHVIYTLGRSRYAININNGSYASPIYFCANVNNLELRAYDYSAAKNGATTVNLSTTETNTVAAPITACDGVDEGDGYISFQLEGKEYKIIAKANSTRTYFWFYDNTTIMSFGEGEVSIGWQHRGGGAMGAYSGSLDVYMDNIQYYTDNTTTVSIVYSKYLVPAMHNYDIEATFSVTGLLKTDGSRVNLTGGKLVFKGESMPF